MCFQLNFRYKVLGGQFFPFQVDNPIEQCLCKKAQPLRLLVQHQAEDKSFSHVSRDRSVCEQMNALRCWFSIKQRTNIFHIRLSG